MTTSTSKNKSSSQRPPRKVKEKSKVFLDVNHIQGRRLRNVLSVNISNVRTVRHLKSVISASHGVSVVGELVYRGVCLEDNRQLAHLMPNLLKIGYSPRFSIRTRQDCIFRPGNASLFVKSLQGSTFQVHLPPDSTIANLKNAIRDCEGYSSNQDFQITCAGKSLSAEDSTLESYNVVSGSLVHVVGRLLGGEADYGRQLGQSFVDMENMSSLRTGKIRRSTPEDPTWQILYYGLNIQGMCRNLHCEAYGSTVYCRKGFTVFNIAEAVKCPSCKTNFIATTCGFNGCEWMFEGRKTGVSSIDLMSKWNVTAKEDFQWFDEAGGRNTSDWSNLIITTKKLPTDVAGTGPAGVEHASDENCVLCFGPMYTASRSAGTSKNARICRHAVHRECSTEFKSAGYNTCPMCRLPLGVGRA